MSLMGSGNRTECGKCGRTYYTSKAKHAIEVCWKPLDWDWNKSPTTGWYTLTIDGLSRALIYPTPSGWELAYVGEGSIRELERGIPSADEAKSRAYQALIAPYSQEAKVQEVYISTDIETDGPIPGVNSMLSFASAAFLSSSDMVGTFSANLELLPGAVPDPDTKREFWDKNPEAWAACRENPQPIRETLEKYVAWVKSLPGKPVFVGYPVSFDHMFVYWYLLKYGFKSPWRFNAIDVRSFAMSTLKCSFQNSGKGGYPAEWIPTAPHTHVALDDAIEQGLIFMNMLEASRR